MTLHTAPTVSGAAAEATGRVFYAVVALIALAGQTIAAHEWLGWPVAFALPAVAALELGGIALAAHADVRRRLGERAIAARALSGSVALFAVVVNWVGHSDRLQAAFFAGMSALGYGVWLVNAGARRRDQMRAAGTLPPVPPAYGLASWLRQPALTRRARALALADPSLGLYGSLAAARAQARAEQRQAALARLLRRKLAEGRDPLAAQIAVTTYDLDEIARRLAEAADYDGLTALIAAELAPHRLTTTTASEPASRPLPATPTDSPATRPTKPARKRAGKPDTATAVTRLRQRHPDMSTVDIARRLGLSDRTVRRYLGPRPATASPALAAA